MLLQSKVRRFDALRIRISACELRRLVKKQCQVFSLNDGRLTTAGTGHIRFWKMASTFTGLKLGDIGKFERQLAPAEHD